MPTVYKVLGQVKPSADTLTSLYTVPASTSAVISTIVVCNTTSNNEEIRIAVRPAGAAIEDKHYLVHSIGMPGLSNYTYTLGITLAATDVLSVYSLTGYANFSLFGSEIS